MENLNEDVLSEIALHIDIHEIYNLLQVSNV